DRSQVPGGDDAAPRPPQGGRGLVPAPGAHHLHLRRRDRDRRAGRVPLAPARRAAPPPLRDRVPPAPDRDPGRPGGLPRADGPAGAAARAAAAGPGAGHGEVPAARRRAGAGDHPAPPVGRSGRGEAMTVLEYDAFTTGQADPDRWQVLQLPTPDGGLWTYGD